MDMSGLFIEAQKLLIIISLRLNKADIMIKEARKNRID